MAAAMVLVSVRGLALAALAEGQHGLVHPAGVVAHDLDDLRRRRGEADALLGGREARILGLAGDAAHATRVAGARGGQRRLEASQGQVLGRGAGIGQGAAGQVAHQPVVGIGFHQRLGAVADARLGDAGEDLSRVLVDLDRRDPQLAGGVAHGAVGEKGQARGAGRGPVGGLGGERVAGRDEGGHGGLGHLLELARFGIEAQGAAAGQQEELAALGQGDELVRPGQGQLRPAAADHEQLGVVVYLAVGLGEEETGGDAAAFAHGRPRCRGPWGEDCSRFFTTRPLSL